jgi:hypothetical protein
MPAFRVRLGGSIRLRSDGLPRPSPASSNVIRPLRRIANVTFRSDFS